MFSLILSMVMGLVFVASRAAAQSERAVDIPTRSNVTQRFLFSSRLSQPALRVDPTGWC